QYPETNFRQFAYHAGLWACAMGVALYFDGAIAHWAYWHAADREHIGNEILKMPGEFQFTVAVALALFMWHPTTWRAAGHLALSAGKIGSNSSRTGRIPPRDNLSAQRVLRLESSALSITI